MKKQPLVSVIVPTKNSEKFLEKCLTSIKNQTYKKIELIVVDNNSTDKTKKIAEKFTNKTFIHGPERSSQRNYGAKKSSGKYLYFVDSDFLLDENVISQCLKEITNHDAIVVHNTPDENAGRLARIRKF